ncbi:MAG: aminotransferase class III-fold pyridoxal phosphate-dependent enzyme [Chloroflexi bacterium]|nr:aminotransferase class III-fold pyridoxal phosphate-dependent enzyme [Chloroflexota bacterium]MCY4247359.1 aminotransferase class III-fold pyridoxal phosphate-dependent enzyme [Chloroflexota bacterium]
MMPENTRPPFDSADAREILRARYRIHASACRELPAELDRNFHLQSAHQGAFVLKIAHHSVSESELDLQNQALQRLRRLRLFPQVVSAADGQPSIHITAPGGGLYRARLLRYIEGAPLRDFRPHSPELLADIGARLGEFSAAMTTFDHAEKRRGYRWNIANLPRVVQFATDMPADKKALLDHFAQLYTDEALPVMSQLRGGFCYNDANDTNILVRADEPNAPHVAGFIDLGDMTYAPVIADLAVALAYVMMDCARPLQRVIPLVAAYHRAFPLQEREISLLFPLAAARLCLSVCISWHQQRREPANRHLSISEDSAWRLLRQLREVHPRRAHYHLRAACGLPASPSTATLRDWLGSQQFAPILGMELTAQNSQLLDLGLQSDLLAQVSDLSDPAAWAAPLQSALRGKVGIGLYKETRPIYLTDMFAITPHHRRALHLGVDFFAAAGAPIYAPLDGIVRVVTEHTAPQDFGPMLIVEHQPRPDLRFYTLYGHLAADALHRWRLGQPVAAGDLLAHIGDHPRNGNWAPHLHFQLVADLLDLHDKVPGVCSPQERDFWTSLCPDPNLLLKLSQSLQPTQQASSQQLLERRRRALNPALSLSYQQPLEIARGHLHYLYDAQGQPFLDCVNNVAHVGHCHPRVTAAAMRQMARLNTNTRYLHDVIIDYAERLCATLPERLSVCFFVNSGSEANELALRLAAAHSGGGDILVIDHAYHGHTSALIDISPYKFAGPGGQGRPAYVQVAQLPDAFRGDARGYDEAAGAYYARSIAEQIESIHARRDKLSAFFAEGILACGGQMPLPAGYLQRAYALTRAAGGVCVADEVQTGFGRVGERFWAFELSGVVPDIVTMGKPIGNGHPLGAVVTTPEIAAAFDTGMEYFNTFGGNPVACAIGLEVLRVIDDERLQANARLVGAYWQRQLQALQGQHPIIGDVRGAGFFLGIELVRDSRTLQPADWEAAYIAERMKAQGILVSTEGPLGNVLKLKPPIIFRSEHVDRFVDVFGDVLWDTVLRVD